MHYIKYLPGIILLVILALLSACGGGGGGGDDDGDGITYTGNSNVAVITTSNAATLVGNVMGDAATTGAITASRGIAGAPSQKAGQTRLARQLSRHLRATLTQTVAAQPAELRTSAKIEVNETDPCESGSTRLTGTLNDDGTGTVTATFINCRFGDETLNGEATARIDAFDLNFIFITDATFSFSALTSTTTTLSVSLSGSIRFQVTFGTNTERLTVNMVTRDNTSGHMTKTENLVIVDVYDNVLFPTSFSETLTGRVFDSVHGFVDIATLVPLVFSTIDQLFPDSGQLLLTGGGNTSIRITAESMTVVMLELDLDGDTIYEFLTTVLWTDVSPTAVIDFVRPTTPVVSANLNGDRSVTISWSPSSDDNGILEYRVRRGIVPIARTQGTTIMDAEVEPGTIVDYYVRAVDTAGNLSIMLPPQSVSIPPAGTGVFDPPISGTLPFASNTYGLGIGVSDVNGDGFRDLVVSGGDANQIATALGPLTAGMSFTASPTHFATMNNDDSNLPLFQLADIMGSNLPEALGAGRTLVWSATTDVWEDSAGSNQSFQFAAPRAYIDLNDDEILDIVSEQGYSICTPTCTNFTRLTGFQGLGNGAYASVGENLAGIENFGLMDLGPVTATDIDRDGLADLIVWDEDTIRVVRQTMPGTFTVASNLLVTNHKYFRAVLLVTDVTGDGYPEVIYAHYPAAVNALRIYVNDGTGNFGSTAISSGVPEPGNFAAGDINGDGIQDLLVRNNLTNDLDLHLSQGDGTFVLSSSITAVGFPFLELADIDRDGGMDILTAGGSNQSTDFKIFINQ